MARILFNKNIDGSDTCASTSFDIILVLRMIELEKFGIGLGIASTIRISKISEQKALKILLIS